MYRSRMVTAHEVRPDRRQIALGIGLAHVQRRAFNGHTVLDQDVEIWFAALRKELQQFCAHLRTGLYVCLG